MAVKVVVLPNTYHDSVKLMTVSSAITGRPGVEMASVAMATPLNLDVLRDDGLTAPELDAVTPNDLVIAARAESEDEAEAAIAAALDLLTARAEPAGPDRARRPRSIGEAVQSATDLNLAIVSVPGRYAAIEAEEALDAGLHVLLFSDNVPIEDEIRLKRFARDRDLLLMGPDCGTAIINGVGLGFANAVRRGPIGIVGASGTGTQQVTCLIDALGSGVSQAIGTGGRDLHTRVGGLTMLQAIAALGDDESTRVIVLISKPPDPTVAEAVLQKAAATSKPVVAVFLGDARRDAPAGVCLARTLTEAAQKAVELLPEGTAAAPPAGIDGTLDFAGDLEEMRSRLRPEQRCIRGLFAGGTLCDEALLLLQERLGPVSSNVLLPPQEEQPAGNNRGHVLVDLGSDEFTTGRAHPMIDPTLRNDWILREADDPVVGCLLLDVVLGYGSHPDPAGALVPLLQEAGRRARRSSRIFPVIISLCGAERDPQDLKRQERTLRDAGALVYRSNAAAALAAASLVQGR